MIRTPTHDATAPAAAQKTPARRRSGLAEQAPIRALKPTPPAGTLPMILECAG